MAAKKKTPRKKKVRCPHCGEVLPPEVFAEHNRLIASKAGKKLSRERGPEYFRDLQAKRKKKAGGRPKKQG